MAASAKTQNTMTQANPLLSDWSTPFKVPPFSSFAAEHFAEAFDIVLKSHRKAVAEISKNTAKPTFDNTIAALESASLPISRVAAVFFNLSSSHTSAELQKIERDIAPRLAEHDSAIYLDKKLFARIDDLFSRRKRLKLDDEQQRLLERYHTWFVRAGAQLKPSAKKRVAEINQRLAELTTAFSQNVLADEQSWHLVLKGKKDLSGLPASAVAAARRAAKDLGLKGKDDHAITLARSSVEGFLTFSDRRDLREEAFKAWTKRGEKRGAKGNPALLSEIVALRGEFAKLMGFNTFADYSLADTMAKTPNAVRDLLGAVWPKAVARAGEERDALAARAASEGSNEAIAPWDWRYYSEKERKARFDLDEGELRPYLQLDNVIAAAFDTANRLFGLKFKERSDIPIYHPDVRAFEVTDKKGKHVAIFYGDYFARNSKRSGAWMSGFRTQHNMGSDPVRPIIVNVMNFARGDEDSPTLLSFDDARTLFHEFGHGLHGMLSDVTYPSLAGTSVSRDFVELPSQLYEHWLMQPEVLEKFALHVDTGKPIPKKLLKRLKAANTFNQGFATVEFTACALLDIELHDLDDASDFNAVKFEKDALGRIGMPGEIAMRHRLPHFSHIMGGYAAGYYSYMWSEVMDADAFEAFVESGDIFAPKVAARLKEHIYSAGNRRDPAEAYLAFRGRMPEIDGLLKKRGFAA